MLHSALVRTIVRSMTVLGICAIFSLALVATPTQGAVDTGLEQTATTAFGKNASLSKDLPTIIGTFIKAALSFVGVIFLILVIYGGFLWMTAAGNEQNVTKAKGIITSAIIGMVIIAAGYAITDFVLTNLIYATQGGSTAPGN